MQQATAAARAAFPHHQRQPMRWGCMYYALASATGMPQLREYADEMSLPRFIARAAEAGHLLHAVYFHLAFPAAPGDWLEIYETASALPARFLVGHLVPAGERMARHMSAVELHQDGRAIVSCSRRPEPYETSLVDLVNSPVGKALAIYALYPIAVSAHDPLTCRSVADMELQGAYHAGPDDDAGTGVRPVDLSYTPLDIDAAAEVSASDVEQSADAWQRHAPASFASLLFATSDQPNSEV